jgi:sulfotransferase family protein
VGGSLSHVIPNFLGIGAPKAGTTWLARCLDEHPDVFIAAVKEVNFLDYESIDGRWAEYEAHFQPANGERAVGEFSTRYLASARAPERVHTRLPTARLIVSLRSPVDQVYSHYWHLLRQNFHQWDARAVPESFTDALERMPDRLLEPARFATHLARWFSACGAEQFLVLLYDELRASPHEVIRRAYEFLGVDPAVVPASLDERGRRMRRGTSPRSPALRRLHARLYGTLSRRVYLPMKRVLGIERAFRIKEALGVRPAMERAFFRSGYPPIEAAARERVLELLGDEMRDLESLLGRSLVAWRFGRPSSA